MVTIHNNILLYNYSRYYSEISTNVYELSFNRKTVDGLLHYLSLLFLQNGTLHYYNSDHNNNIIHYKHVRHNIKFAQLKDNKYYSYIFDYYNNNN